jgi:hypothetical protein
MAGKAAAEQKDPALNFHADTRVSIGASRSQKYAQSGVYQIALHLGAA